MLVRRVKEMWHEELVADPETHAWVLSLYRAGEFHPETVDDYFPVDAASSPELRASIARHAKDERRHVRIYDRAIARLGQPRSELLGLDVFNVAIREHTKVDFSTRGVAGRDERDERLAHFLAHAYFLETRISRSLEYHLDACERAGRADVGRVVAAVHADEERHTSYTLEAVKELLPKAKANEVLATHRRGEARANLAFSARQVRAFLARFATTRSHAFVYRVSARMMEAGLVALSS
jgi:hypothetical protein